MIKSFSESETIPERVFREIVSDINSGKLKSGERLPGDRLLAEQYGAGRSSMISALRLLQQKGYIERMPMRGTFVRKDVRKATSEVKICFPLPELTMLPERLGYANYIANMEITQGLIYQGSANNFSVASRYMEDSDDPLVIRRQLEFIQQTSDAVVFFGHQFLSLKEMIFQQNIPAVVISPQYFWGQSRLPSCGYNLEPGFREFAERLAGDGCKSLGIISMTSSHEPDRLDLELRRSMFRDQLEKYGIRVRNYQTTMHAHPSEAVYDEIVSILNNENELPDTLCGTHYPTIVALLQLMYERNHQFKVTALAGGGIFSMLNPQLSYVRVPLFEMGQKASAMLVDAVKTGKTKFENQEITAKVWPYLN